MPPTITAPASVTAKSPLDPARTAIVVIDMVNWQVPRAGDPAGYSDEYVSRLAGTVIPNLRKLLSAARDSGAQVVFLRVGSDRPDFSDAVKPFQERLRQVGGRDGSRACAVIDELAPVDGDINLLKTGSGGFHTSPLDQELRALDIEHVVYTGVITNGCVTLTAASGFDLGYQGYVVSDATASYSAALHDAALTVLDFYIAKAVTTDELIDQLTSG